MYFQGSTPFALCTSGHARSATRELEPSVRRSASAEGSTPAARKNASCSDESSGEHFLREAASAGESCRSKNSTRSSPGGCKSETEVDVIPQRPERTARVQRATRTAGAVRRCGARTVHAAHHGWRVHPARLRARGLTGSLHRG